MTWRTKCNSCGVLSDPIPAKVASKWGVPSFDISLTSRSILGQEREMLPIGWYSAKITAVEPVKVKKQGPNTGKPMYKITCSIAEGKYTGRALLKWVCLFDPAWQAYKQISKALEWELELDENREPIPKSAKELLDQVLKISVVHEPGFRDEGMVAAIKAFAGIGSDPTTKGKVRIAI